jgi:hypothetical protein
LDDGSTYVLRRTIVPDEWQFRIVDPVRRMAKVRSDSILQIGLSGEIVWQWHAHEHLDLNNPGTGGWTRYTSPNSGAFRMADWSHINTISPLPDNAWYDEGNNTFMPGNLLVHARNFSTSMIVDRESGKIVWEYSGDDNRSISGGHEPSMIPKGLRGAGNILLLDNGKNSPEHKSRIIEINPVNKEIVWSYSAADFYTPSAGSVQRLLNGNTLISEDRHGRVFEINTTGQIVWQYKSNFETNRARLYAKNYCELANGNVPKRSSIVAWLKSWFG